MNAVTSQITDRLVEMFTFFDQSLGFNLPTPVFALIPNQGKQSYYGWFRNIGWNTEDGMVPEINLTADQLQRPVDDLCGTILHEMAHYANWKDGVEDCNKAQYHNKHFKKKAEAFGLSVSKRPNKGWATTELGDDGKRMVAEYKAKYLPNGENPFNAHRIVIREAVKENPNMIITVKKEVGVRARELYDDGKSFREAIEGFLQSLINKDAVKE